MINNVPSVPCQGSKRKLAVEIVSQFPSAEHFVDLFAGGGAVTSAAILSHKYKQYTFNDYYPNLAQFYVDVINGKYANHTQWVSREEFNEKKATDPFIATVWSFGNNRNTYLYGDKYVSYKRAFHAVVVDEDYSYFHAMGINPPQISTIGLRERKLELGRWLKGNQDAVNLTGAIRPDVLEHIARYLRLMELQMLAPVQEITATQLDYKDVVIPENAIVYADPPYASKSGYEDVVRQSGFIHEEFCEWVRLSPHLIYISEYSMPNDFVCVWKKVHRCAMNDKFNTPVVEKLFVHESKIQYHIPQTLF